MPTKRFENLDPGVKNRLLSAAAGEFAEHGFDHASLNRIIQIAKISKGSFYYYFEDKVDLYVTAVRSTVSGFGTMVEDFLNDRMAGGFWEALRDVFKQTLQHWVSNPRLVTLLYGGTNLLLKTNEEGPVAELFGEIKHWTTRVLEKGIQMGEVRTDIPTELLVEVVYSVGEAMDMWCLSRWEELADSGMEPMLDIYEDMFRRVVAPREAVAGG
jgi:AcrR family transcriptional regulator